MIAPDHATNHSKPSCANGGIHTWHLDEVFVKVNGKLCYLWRAVDHEGEVLEAVVTARRDKAAALKLLNLRFNRNRAPLGTTPIVAACSAWGREGIACFPDASLWFPTTRQDERCRDLNSVCDGVVA